MALKTRRVTLGAGAANYAPIATADAVVGAANPTILQPDDFNSVLWSCPMVVWIANRSGQLVRFAGSAALAAATDYFDVANALAPVCVTLGPGDTLYAYTAAGGTVAVFTNHPACRVGI